MKNRTCIFTFATLTALAIGVSDAAPPVPVAAIDQKVAAPAQKGPPGEPEAQLVNATETGDTPASCDVEGPSPNLTQAEEGGFALTESLLSITAALVTKWGCEGVATAMPGAGLPVSIEVLHNGAGRAVFPSGGFDPIELGVVRTAEMAHFGTKYDVYQKNSPGTLGMIEPVAPLVVSDFAGDLDYNEGGAILSSHSTFLMREYSRNYSWGEQNIKDFWQQGPKGAHVRDCGTEVIKKEGYPLTKWRQYSDYYRWPRLDFGPEPGTVVVHKRRIAPWGLTGAQVQLEAETSNVLSRFRLRGSIKVVCGS